MTRRIVAFAFTIVLAPTVMFGQKQGNIWYFPQYSGLDFSTGIPDTLSDGQASDSEGCSSICDSAGNLLMYAIPTTVWNRDHIIMPNGSGLMGGNSSTQGVLIIPRPGGNEIFYVFTLDEFQNDLVNGLRYSMVNMCLDNGMGDVDTANKNILLLDGTGEKMTATFHSNGSDIWLVTRKHFTNEFYSFLITSSGISSPVISAVGWDNPQQGIPNSIGQMKISPDGSKLAFAVANQSPYLVQLFDFNNSTGIVSNVIDLPTSLNSGGPYGVSFSPDNSKLYIWGPTPTGLNQFDLSSGIPDTIINSLYHVPWGGPYGGTGIQLANDGKIYVCQPPQNIGVINSPNLAGSACDFVGNAITTNSYYSLPGFIDSYNYKNGIPNCKTTSDEEYPGNHTSVYPNLFSAYTVLSSDYSLHNATLTLSNCFGQTVSQIANINGETIVLHRDNLPVGLYFVYLTEGSKVIAAEKIIITD